MVFSTPEWFPGTSAPQIIQVFMIFSWEHTLSSPQVLLQRRDDSRKISPWYQNTVQHSTAHLARRVSQGNAKLECKQELINASSSHTETPCKNKGKRRRDREAVLVSKAIFVRNMILVSRRGLMRALQGGKQKATWERALWDSWDGRSGRRPLGPVEARYIGHFIGGRDAIQSRLSLSCATAWHGMAAVMDADEI
jgi:hypothetical protein